MEIEAVNRVKREFKGWLKEFSGKGPEDEDRPYEFWSCSDHIFGCVNKGEPTAGAFAGLGCIIRLPPQANTSINIEKGSNGTDKDEQFINDKLKEKFNTLFDRFGSEGTNVDTNANQKIIEWKVKNDETDKMKAFLAEYADLRGWGLEAHKETGDWECQKNIDNARRVILSDKEYNALNFIDDDETLRNKVKLALERPVKLVELENLPQAKDVIGLINNGVHQIIFTGAPGTGKTYIAKEIAKKLGSELKDNTSKNNNYEFVQFHPSYDYTDFVEGLRPVDVGEGGIKFVKLDGIFKKFCRRVAAKNKPNEKYFFIIDEINRADLSKVFGELMYCLEKDKRGETINTQYQNLPTYEINDNGKAEPITYDEFENGFYIPENVVIIGTMNDIDRSVESMDFALRRRFTWKEFEVNEDMLKTALPGVLKNKNIDANELSERIMNLNNEIKKGERFGLNEQYYISQGQFAHLSDDINEKDINGLCQYVWDYRIKSLLREYVRGERGVEEFITKCRGQFIPENNPTQNSEGPNNE